MTRYQARNPNEQYQTDQKGKHNMDKNIEMHIKNAIKDSLIVHDIVLEKVISGNIFIIGNDDKLLDFIDDGKLDAEPLQINGERMLSATREGNFDYTYFIKKDKNLINFIEHITKDNKYIDNIDVNKLAGIVFHNPINFLTVKDKEFNMKNVKNRINVAFPIADEEAVHKCEKIMMEIFGKVIL